MALALSTIATVSNMGIAPEVVVPIIILFVKLIYQELISQYKILLSGNIIILSVSFYIILDALHSWI